MLTEDSILIRSEDILESDLGTEKVVMSIDKGRYFGLNEVGKIIHDGCDGQTSLGDIVRLLSEQFEVKPQECASKVLVFAERLLTAGLLEVPEK